MTVTVHFACDGCDAETKGTRFLQRHFHSLDGKGYGFGVWKHDGVQEVLPEGWVAFDPYTGCCYCPECWADIEKGDAA